MIEARAFRTALVVAPVLVLAGYLGALALSDVVVDDRGLLALAGWPALASLVLALVVPRERRRWWSAAIGCVVGVGVAVAVVSGVVWLVAAMLSDP